jgi:transcriptional regulator
MYNLPYHKENDPTAIQAFINKYPFAFLSGCDLENRPIATQIPLFMEEKEGKILLSGHIMKGTDHHLAFEQNPNVLAVFTGHHVYVSGTWYSNPYTASTWNYMSVHAKGHIRFLDEAALEEMLRKTSLHFEDYQQESTTVYDQLPSDFKKRVLKMIIAFEIEVSAVDNVFKLSQDRDLQSYLNIIEKLRERGESGQAIAEEMERRIGEVFSN